MKNILLIPLFVFLLVGCQFNQKEKKNLDSDRKVSSVSKEFDPNYESVQAVFNARCIACHSCYNAPCQLDLTSYSGTDRGANKSGVFDFELGNRTPTRMGIDANSTEEWRHKHKFFSVTEKIPNPFAEKNDKTPYSLMWNLLTLAKNEKHSLKNQGLFTFERHKYCPKSGAEWDTLLETAFPSEIKSMPFGFPALNENELSVIEKWLQKGAHGPTSEMLSIKRKPDDSNLPVIKKIEDFLNNEKTPYQQIVARYIFEHLHLAHVYFPGNKNEYYKLIRTDRPRSAWEFDQEIIELATRRPTDDPGSKFYYIFKKITSTIVQKTHVLYPLDENKLNRWRVMFETDKPHSEVTTLPSRKLELALNPYITFKDLPAKARFQFLLDNNFYHVQSFILGPVCRGQLAVDAIDDHFWVFFIDPDRDPMLQNKGKFLVDHADLLGTAGVKDNEFNIKMNENVVAFRKEKEKLYNNFVFTNELVWKGIPNQLTSFPVLTVFRHFDNASVSMGPLGGIPKTIWILDYHVFEELYYNLVAGYDVFSGRFHQLRTRLLMDGTRVNSQDIFLGFMPSDSRKRLRDSWHEKYNPIYDPFTRTIRSLNELAAGDLVSKYPTQNSVGLNIEKNILDSVSNIFPDKYEQKLAKDAEQGKKNKVAEQFKKLEVAKNIKSLIVKKWINDGVKNVTTAADVSLYEKIAETDCCNNSSFLPLKPLNEIESKFSSFTRIKSVNLDKLPDLIHIYIPDPDLSKNESHVYTMIVNKVHYNLDQISNEANRRDFRNDYIAVLKGFVGSYPNQFLKIPRSEVPQFVELMRSIVFEFNLGKKMWKNYYTHNKWIVKRLDPGFWSVYDALNGLYRQMSPLEAGVIDLSHYMHYYEDIEEVYR